MLTNIRSYIGDYYSGFGPDPDYHGYCSANLRLNTLLGHINKIYEPIGYGAGPHTNEVSVGGYEGDRDILSALQHHHNRNLLR
jgi:hypothetical protein